MIFAEQFMASASEDAYNKGYKTGIDETGLCGYTRPTFEPLASQYDKGFSDGRNARPESRPDWS
jgi:hypothetical protein